MTAINKELLVPYSAKQMYDLVNDINKYHEFLPWCVRSEIIEQNSAYITAGLTVAHKDYSGISQKLITKNTLTDHYNQDKSYTINMSLVEGPLKFLDGTWLFKDLDDENNGCKVQLNLEFEFSNMILAMAFSKFFEKIISELVNSFYLRAQDVYGSHTAVE